MKPFWIFCCFFGLTLGQSQMIDIKCPKNHFLGNIMTHVPSATGFICITCHRLYSAEHNNNSSQSLVLCYANSEWQIDRHPRKETILRNHTIEDQSLCGVNFFIKSDSIALMGLITCAKENYKKLFLERGSMICPFNSTLSKMSHSATLHEMCILCEWNKTYEMKSSSLCTRKLKPENRSYRIYTDPNSGQCDVSNCPEDELKNMSCGYKVSANSSTLNTHNFLASNLIPCHHDFGRAQNLQVSVYPMFNFLNY